MIRARIIGGSFLDRTCTFDAYLESYDAWPTMSAIKLINYLRWRPIWFAGV